VSEPRPDLLAEIDAVLEAASPPPSRYTMIRDAVAAWVAGGDRQRTGLGTSWASRVARVAEGAELEELQAKVGAGVLTAHSCRKPAVLYVSAELAAALTATLDATAFAMGVHEGLPELATICQGFLYGVGPAEESVYRHDRLHTVNNEVLQVILQGTTGLASLLSLQEVVKTDIAAAPANAARLRLHWNETFHPRPAAIAGYFVGTLITELVSARNTELAKSPRPGSPVAPVATLDDELRHWVRDGSGEAALRGALERNCLAARVPTFQRTTLVRELMENLAHGKLGAAVDPAWAGGQNSTQPEVHRAQDVAKTIVAAVTASIDLHALSAPSGEVGVG